MAALGGAAGGGAAGVSAAPADIPFARAPTEGSVSGGDPVRRRADSGGVSCEGAAGWRQTGAEKEERRTTASSLAALNGSRRRSQHGRAYVDVSARVAASASDGSDGERAALPLGSFSASARVSVRRLQSWIRPSSSTPPACPKRTDHATDWRRVAWQRRPRSGCSVRPSHRADRAQNQGGTGDTRGEETGTKEQTREENSSINTLSHGLLCPSPSRRSSLALELLTPPPVRLLRGVRAAVTADR